MFIDLKEDYDGDEVENYLNVIKFFIKIKIFKNLLNRN